MTTTGKDTIGMLLIGHGTRDQQGISEFLATGAMVANLLPQVCVEAAFLELAEPAIGDGLARLAARRVSQVVVAPLLLFAAGHAKDDIPQAVASAARGFPGLAVRQAEPLGCHPRIVELSELRCQTAIADEGLTGDDVHLLMVGRGSSDDSATAEMRRFTTLRARRSAVAEATTAFMAIAQPSLSEALRDAAAGAASIVVVQPHLLFHGQLLRRLRDMVEETRHSVPTKKWVVADHLGPARFVAEAAADRFLQAAAREGV